MRLLHQSRCCITSRLWPWLSCLENSAKRPGCPARGKGTQKGLPEGNSPRNTRMVPTHCKSEIGLAKRITDAKMVKNLRVVVTIEQVRGPKYTTVMKMKLCNEMETTIQSGWKVRKKSLEEFFPLPGLLKPSS